MSGREGERESGDVSARAELRLGPGKWSCVHGGVREGGGEAPVKQCIMVHTSGEQRGGGKG